MLGEATDHFAQTEIEQMDSALKVAESQSKTAGSNGGSGGTQLSNMTTLLSQVPGTSDLARQAQDLQAQSDAQEKASANARPNTTFQGPPGSATGPPGPNIPGTNFDPMKTASQIYPILEFRDKVVKAISATIEKIPGLEALVEKITDTLTLFILGLLAPFIRPIINAVSQQLKNGSTGVIDASGRHQFEPWTDPNCSDPTHSLLSKDHFSNVLNEPAGQVASSILQYVAPRVIYAWQHPDVPVEQVLNDVVHVFHHPAIRDHHSEIHQNMFSTVERWARSRPDGGSNLNILLSSQSVKDGKNHTVPQDQQSHSHGGLPSMGKLMGGGSLSKITGAPWEAIGRFRDAPDVGPDGREIPSSENTLGAFPGTQTQFDATRPPTGPEAGYAAQPEYQIAQQDPYAQPPYPPGAQPYHEANVQYQQGYPAPQESQYPPQGGYPSQQPQSGYQGPRQYGFGPNAPPPAGQYNNQGPPPPQQYGYGGPHPPSPYY